MRDIVEDRIFPSLDKEGWPRPQEKCREASSLGADGVVRSTSDYRWLEPIFLDAARCRACASRPSARANVASRNLLDRAATPPYPRRGIRSLSDRARVEQQPRRPGAKIVSPLR